MCDERKTYTVARHANGSYASTAFSLAKFLVSRPWTRRLTNARGWTPSKSVARQQNRGIPMSKEQGDHENATDLGKPTSASSPRYSIR